MAEKNTMKRSLKTRHLSMIALGGSIGTGLFVASGSAISTAGPGGRFSGVSRYWSDGLLFDDIIRGNGNLSPRDRFVCDLCAALC